MISTMEIYNSIFVFIYRFNLNKITLTFENHIKGEYGITR